MSKNYNVIYIGADMAEIRNGDICEAHDLNHSTSPNSMGEVIAVKDRSGEFYIYPKRLFEIIE